MKSVTNIEKESIIMRSFISKTEIQKLMDTSNWKFVQEVFEEARKQVKNEGKKLYHNDKVPRDIVIKVLGINEKEIHKNAAIERQIKKDASIKSLATRSIQ